VDLERFAAELRIRGAWSASKRCIPTASVTGTCGDGSGSLRPSRLTPEGPQPPAPRFARLMGSLRFARVPLWTSRTTRSAGDTAILGNIRR
jgi:hypothetical protein